MFCSKEWVKDLLTKVLKKKLNNYSLEEQKVGTWIDGKPLYQKTFKFGTLKGRPNVDFEVDSPDAIFIAEGYGISIDGTIKPLFFSYPETVLEENETCTAFIYGTKDKLGFRLGTNVEWSETVVTLRYTKTTD